MSRSIRYGLSSLISDGSITGAKLANGAVTNDKINASAAIDESKIAFSASGHAHGGGASGNPITLAADGTQLIAGQTIAANKAVYVESTATDYAVITNPGAAAEQDFGSSAYPKLAQKLTTVESFDLSKFTVSVKKASSPTDNIIITLEADNAGAPSGTALATLTIAGGTLTTSFADKTHTLPTPITLTANTSYWIVFARSGAGDSTNKYVVETAASNNYAGGQQYLFNGTSWSAMGVDIEFTLTMTTVVGRAYVASAAAAARATKFIGFAAATAQTGETVTVVRDGPLDGFSGLTPGAPYFLANGEGTIATSAGSTSKRVGLAKSATVLIVENELN